ncbi:ketose-bisphosphate aldolase [Chlamydiia bacterium]|nr:ketose-bisphosphate aldolase [Chlamydiia bacterium]
MNKLLEQAQRKVFAIAAFNITDYKQLQTICSVCEKSNSPVILQFSRSAIKYLQKEMLTHALRSIDMIYPNLIYCCHLDHGNTTSSCVNAIEMGFKSVMIDGSLLEDGKTPSSYQYNVDVTSRMVELAHKLDVSVEGELGCLGSLETLEATKEDGQGAEGRLSETDLLTDVMDAYRFINETNIDTLAIAVGTSHGAHKFYSKSSREMINISRIDEIHKKCPNTPLVLHGASAVYGETVNIINNHGGRISNAKGVEDDVIIKSVAVGIRKINVDTDLRLAYTAGLRQHLDEHPESFNIRDHFDYGYKMMALTVLHKMKLTGQFGKASVYSQPQRS